jgi:glutamine transport system substrate-binding protein
MIKALSEKLGFTYTLSPMDFTALLMSAQTGKVDMAAAGITITKERQATMTFSSPYYDAGLLVMVRQNNDTIKSVDDLAGKTVAVKESTTSAKYISEMPGVGKITIFPNIENAYMELERGAADAVVYDAPNIQYYIKVNPQSNTKTVGDLFDAAQFGFLFPKDSVYAAYVTAALEEFKKDGTYNSIYAKWFGGN